MRHQNRTNRQRWIHKRFYSIGLKYKEMHSTERLICRRDGTSGLINFASLLLTMPLFCNHSSYFNEENKTFKFEKRHVSATPVPSSVCGWYNNDVQYVQYSAIYCTSLLFHPQTDDGTGVAETCLFSNLKVLFSSLRLLQNCCFYLLLETSSYFG